jgi:hypothetical protein
MKINIILISLFLLLAGGQKSVWNRLPEPGRVDKSAKTADVCEWNGIKLYGKVQFVEGFADIKIQFVDDFPDLDVEFVDAFPDACGKWQVVDAFPDFTVQVVDDFPDLKVRAVSAFPGMKN